MRIFLVLFCSFALACVAGAHETKKKSKSASKATQAQPVHPQQTHVIHPETHGGSPAGEPRFQQTKAPQHVLEPPTNPTRPAEVRTSVQPKEFRATPARAATVAQPAAPPLPAGVGTTVQPKELGATTAHAAPVAQPAAPPLTKEQKDDAYAQSQGFRSAEQYRKWKETGRLEGLERVATTGASTADDGAGSSQKPGPGITTAPSGVASVQGKAIPFRPRQFNLPTNPEPGIVGVTFQQNRPIDGCKNWQGANYAMFRDYNPVWHNRTWWETHHSRIVLMCGGWYYWDAGYWFPAWGYESNARYVYDGPIYAYNNLPPDQVVANVQSALQQLGYYHGTVNGRLDALTRTAIANYQRDRGLYTTSAIDEPTLASLGMA